MFFCLKIKVIKQQLTPKLLIQSVNEVSLLNAALDLSTSLKMTLFAIKTRRWVNIFIITPINMKYVLLALYVSKLPHMLTHKTRYLNSPSAFGHSPFVASKWESCNTNRSFVKKLLVCSLRSSSTSLQKEWRSFKIAPEFLHNLPLGKHTGMSLHSRNTNNNEP